MWCPCSSQEQVQTTESSGHLESPRIFASSASLMPGVGGLPLAGGRFDTVPPSCALPRLSRPPRTTCCTRNSRWRCSKLVGQVEELLLGVIQLVLVAGAAHSMPCRRADRKVLPRSAAPDRQAASQGPMCRSCANNTERSASNVRGSTVFAVQARAYTSHHKNNILGKSPAVCRWFACYAGQQPAVLQVQGNGSTRQVCGQIWRPCTVLHQVSRSTHLLAGDRYCAHPRQKGNGRQGASPRETRISSVSSSVCFSASSGSQAFLKPPHKGVASRLCIRAVWIQAAFVSTWATTLLATYQEVRRQAWWGPWPRLRRPILAAAVFGAELSLQSTEDR